MASGRSPDDGRALRDGRRDESPARTGILYLRPARTARTRYDRRDWRTGQHWLIKSGAESTGRCACSYAGWQVPIKTDGTFSKARIIEIDGARVRRDLEAGRIAVIAG